MIIQYDSREKARAITKILAYFDSIGIKHFVSKLPVGDYMSLDNPRLVVDRKQNLLELCANFSDVPKKDKNGKFKLGSDGKPMTDRKRFIAEMKRAKEYGIKLVVLCEHGGSVKTLADVSKWKNPRLKKSPLTMSGERLYKMMAACAAAYDVEWQFCDKSETGRRIVEILGGDT